MKAATQAENLPEFAQLEDTTIRKASEVCRTLGARHVGSQNDPLQVVKAKLGSRAWPEVLTVEDESPKTKAKMVADQIMEDYLIASGRKRRRPKQEETETESDEETFSRRPKRARVGQSNTVAEALQPQPSDVTSPLANQQSD